MLTGLVVESGEARDVHHMCTLLGYGADAICPYLAMEAIVALQEDGKVDGRASRLDLIENYIKVDTPLCLVSCFCVLSLGVLSLCLLSLCLVSVSCLCVSCLCVSCLCALSLCLVSVPCPCVLSLCVLCHVS